MTVRTSATLLLLGALWGGSFIFIHLGVAELSPWFLMEVRVVAASIILLAVVKGTGASLGIRMLWRKYLLIGAAGAGIPFTLIAISEQYIPAEIAAILNATTPLWTAGLLAVFLGEPITVRRAGGLVAGVIGVCVLVGWNSFGLSGRTLYGIGVMLVAAALYAISGVFVARALRGVAPLAIATGQQLGACVVLLVPAAFTVPRSFPSFGVVMSIVVLAVAGTALAHVLFYWVMKEAGAMAAMSVTLLVPIFGTLWGGLFLGESVGRGVIPGLVIILASVGLVNRVSLGKLQARVSRPRGSADQLP